MVYDLSESYDYSSAYEWDEALKLLFQEDISEIQANGPSEFFIKRSGRRAKLEGLNVGTPEKYAKNIETGLAPLVTSLEPFNPEGYLFEGVLRLTNSDGESIKARCHIVLPPASEYPQVTIAKKTKSLPSLESIANAGAMSTEMLVFLMKAVEAELSLVVSGGTGTGKTTLMEAATKLIRNSARIGVAEDSPELELIQPNVTYLHSVPWKPGMDPNNVATLSWVVQQFQRMRIDKVIIGETRGKEFADFLIAANSGMDGSMTTIHADDAVTCLDKMANFAMQAQERPIRSINMDIANSIDIIVQLSILPDGRHKVSQIQEITRQLNNDDTARISTATLYEYVGFKESFKKASPISDTLRKKFEKKGVSIRDLLNVPIGTEAGPHTPQRETSFGKEAYDLSLLKKNDSNRIIP